MTEVRPGHLVPENLGNEEESPLGRLFQDGSMARQHWSREGCIPSPPGVSVFFLLFFQ